MKQDTLQRARERWQDATDAQHELRDQMLEDLRFSNPADPQQWDDKVKRARETAEGGVRPCFTFDRTGQYIAQVVNDARMNKPQIQTLAVDSGADPKVAEALDGLIRHIEYASRASIAYDTAIEHAARIGLGWLRIVPEITNGELNEQDIRIKRVHDPLSIKPMPGWTEPDGSDITGGFVETRILKADFERQHKGKKTTGWGSDESGWFDDGSIRIVEYFEIRTTRKNMLVILDPDSQQRIPMGEDEYWTLVQQVGFKPQVVASYSAEERTVEWSKFSGVEELEDATEFPSRWVPLIPVIGYELWIEGKRHLCGMVRRMMDAQRAYNIERSNEIEMKALQPKAPYLAAWESVEQHSDKWATANTSNRAYLPYNAYDDQGRQLPMPQRMQPPTIGSSFAQGSMQATADMEASVGMFAANLGKPSNETSGIAIKRREQQGDTANFHYVDNLARSIEHCGRIVVDMIPRIYDTPRQLRILGIDGQAEVVQSDPNMQAPKKMQGRKLAAINLQTGTYDVRVKVGPAYASLREEAADSLTKIVQQSPQLMTVLGPMWARMQDWPEAEKVSKLLLALAPPQVQAIESSDAEIPPELQGKLDQLQQQGQALSQALEKAAEHAEQLEAKLNAKEGELEVKRYQAETDRMQALAAAITPEQVQAVVIQTLQQMLSQPASFSPEMNEPVRTANVPDGSFQDNAAPMGDGTPPAPGYALPETLPEGMQ